MIDVWRTIRYHTQGWHLFSQTLHCDDISFFVFCFFFPVYLGWREILYKYKGSMDEKRMIGYIIFLALLFQMTCQQFYSSLFYSAGQREKAFWATDGCNTLSHNWVKLDTRLSAATLSRFWMIHSYKQCKQCLAVNFFRKLVSFQRCALKIKESTKTTTPTVST